MADSAGWGAAARLCANCEHAMVDDFDKEFQMWPDYKSGTKRAIPRSGGDVPTEFFLIDHLPNLPQLRDSAQQGCDFCEFLRTLVLLDETRDRLRSECKTDIASLGPAEIEIKVTYKWNQKDVDDHSVNNYLVVNVDFGSGIRCDYWNSLHEVEGHADVAKQLSLSKPLSQSYSDTETVDWLKASIATCEQNEQCAQKSDYLPDRLLDTTEGKVRLVLRESLNVTKSGLHPDYAALSYCWGTSEDAQVQLKTTHSSLAQRQAGIQREDVLSVPALHDAIRITRELEIPYLWIDSLCILQDDISDWERNSSSMDKVYGSAKVTLVAAASRSCREGFLKTKGQKLLLPFRSKAQPSVRGLIQLQFKFPFTNKVGTAHDSYVDFCNTPLSRRGWTVQERLLAARQIVFGPCNVHFICPNWRQSRGARPCEVQDFAMSKLDNEQTSALYGTWSQVLREFQYITAESFTNPSDLLPALSGLAHCFNRRLQDEYCAGHWKKERLTSLMWTRTNFSSITKTTHLQSHRSPVPYLLPSWSQLCKGYLNLYEITHIEDSMWEWTPSHLSDAPEVESLDWERCLLRNDPMGALTSAKLNIRTRVMKLAATKALKVQHPRPQNTPPEEGWETQKWKIVSGDHVGTGLASLNVYLDYNSTKANVGLDALGWKWVLMGSCSMRHLHSNSRRSRLFQSYEGYRYPYGLIVAPLREDEEEWCRVGIFTPRDFEDFSLNDFTECSEVESITIV